MKDWTIINLIFFVQIVYSQCEEGFIFIEDVPPSVTMWPADSCFYSADYSALEDVLFQNELSSYSNPLEMGTQTWINGRLKNWVADYNFSGSGLSEPISVLPESIENWTELTYLALQWNNLSSIPESLDQLIGLSSLYISNNQLNGLPETIGNLSNLFFLDLGYNQIEEIPENFCNLQNLSYLWIFNNDLAELPDCVCDLNIDWSGIDGAWYPYFGIGGNYLCENLPECISNSEHLDISLDQFIYSFMVEDPQNCDILEVVFQADWNLVGLPLEVENPLYTAVFPTSIPGTLFTFDNTYTQTDVLTSGIGNWLRFENQGSTVLNGIFIEELSINLISDWNIISGISETINLTQVNDPDNILIPGTFYGFNETYYQTTQLEPGKGYWVRAIHSGEISLSASAPLSRIKSFQPPSHLNTLKFQNTILYFGEDVQEENAFSYSLPPKPPWGARDIRFLGDTKLCTTNECIVEVTKPSRENIVIECNINDGMDWEIVDNSGNVSKCGNAQALEFESDSKTFILRKSISQNTPTNFALFPAHPNPFNPSTTIRFFVPELSKVEVSIYDGQGRFIETLLNEQLAAGNHNVAWNANRFSTGVYFAKIESSGFLQFEKLLMVK